MNIAIVGYGIEGKSAYRYYRALYPDASIMIYDQKPITDIPTDAQMVVGGGKFPDIDADIVVRSPGIRPDLIEASGVRTSVTNEFFAKCHAPIIGVTGTKGKGTTASLIRSILDASDKKVWLVGNIGQPALDILQEVKDDDIVVYELSSFQLWDLEHSPHTAVILMIEADHLDVHPNFADYVNAKSHITSYQAEDDKLIYCRTNEAATHIAIQSRAQKYPYQHDDFAHVSNEYFYYGSTQLCAVSSLSLPGVHNQDNACAAINAVWEYVQEGAVIKKGLQKFTGLPHRLKYVREMRGVSYYDDSIATTPGSAIAAIHSFENPKVLILGGSDKGADFTRLYESIEQGNVRSVITIGTLGPAIAAKLKERGFENVNEVESSDMAAIVSVAAAIAQDGDIVILSPACASFDMFRGYADRGEQFIAAVEHLS